MSVQRVPEVLAKDIFGTAAETGEIRAEFDLRIPAELVWFEGHFPGTPVLPGVVLIDWVMAMCSDLSLTGAFAGMSRLKFMRIIRPETQLKLQIVAPANGAKVVFRYFDEAGDYASGTISLRN